MKKLYCFKLSLLLFLSVVGCLGNFANAETHKIAATIIDHGVIDSTPKASDTAEESKESHNGALFVMDADEVPTFKKSEDKSKIFIKPGVQFGIEVQLDGGRDQDVIPVRTRWTHPKFEDGVVTEEWASPMNIGYGRYAGWVVEDDSEMVAGDWTVEILYQGKAIARQTFHVSLESE